MLWPTEEDENLSPVLSAVLLLIDALSDEDLDLLEKYLTEDPLLIPDCQNDRSPPSSPI